METWTTLTSIQILVDSNKQNKMRVVALDLLNILILKKEKKSSSIRAQIEITYDEFEEEEGSFFNGYFVNFNNYFSKY